VPAARWIGGPYRDGDCRADAGGRRRFYDNCGCETIARLAVYLEARRDGGRPEDRGNMLAASQFMMTCQASLFLPFVFQAAPAPSANEPRQVVRSATQMFLAAYRAKT